MSETWQKHLTEMGPGPAGIIFETAQTQPELIGYLYVEDAGEEFHSYFVMKSGFTPPISMEERGTKVCFSKIEEEITSPEQFWEWAHGQGTLGENPETQQAVEVYAEWNL